jgi:hypothetical protein
MTVAEPDFELTIGEHISRSLRPSNAPEKSRYVAYADGKKDRRVILIEDPEDVFGDGINHSGDIALLEIVGRYPAYYKAVLRQVKTQSPVLAMAISETQINSGNIENESADRHPLDSQDSISENERSRNRMTFYFKVDGETYYLPISHFEYYLKLREFAKRIKKAADQGERILRQKQGAE